MRDNDGNTRHKINTSTFSSLFPSSGSDGEASRENTIETNRSSVFSVIQHAKVFPPPSIYGFPDTASFDLFVWGICAE